MHPGEPLASAWLASLDLGFGRQGERTVLHRRRHEGPLRVQKPLYPEGDAVCHAVLLHPPAGIAGGDQLQMAIEVGAGAAALLTTPGAGKWYRSVGPLAEQRVSLKVDAGGTVEWLPQESIVFDGALARMQTRVDLAPGACFLGMETLCLGRRQSGEQFSRGTLRLATDIRLDGMPLWHERGIIEGGSPLMASPVGLAGHGVCATVLAAGVDIAPETLMGCRAVMPAEPAAQSGITAMPQLLVARYLGDSAEAARQWFLGLWQVLRPAVCGRDAVMPRIWNT